ncbi:MAG: putative glycolipid-binding domain-containing protein [Pseudomonas sp.]
MQQTLVWKPWAHPGVENLRLHMDSNGIHASSHLLLSLNGHSLAATYVVDYDPRWRFRRLWLKVDNLGQKSLSLQRDIRGNWYHNGEPRPDLAPCQQPMLSASPFTHTPALQRCALETGQSEQLQVAYIDLLSLEIEPRPQRYLCLRQQAEQSSYRYETPGTPASELTLDRHGLLIQASEQYLRLSARTLAPLTSVERLHASKDGVSQPPTRPAAQPATIL